jgi:hypothetical protein
MTWSRQFEDPIRAAGRSQAAHAADYSFRDRGISGKPFTVGFCATGLCRTNSLVTGDAGLDPNADNVGIAQLNKYTPLA